MDVYILIWMFISDFNYYLFYIYINTLRTALTNVHSL